MKGKDDQLGITGEGLLLENAKGELLNDNHFKNGFRLNFLNLHLN
jgi:hypothetical protein